VARPPSPRAVSDARLSARIAVLLKQRRGVYGSPRIWAELVVDDGERIGRKRVERLMRQAGLSGLITKKYKATTIRVPGVRVADDLLDRDFHADAANQRWVADITYLRTWEGRLYLVAVQDLYSPQDRRLEHGRSHAHRARHRRAAHGARAPAPGPWADLAFRSGQPGPTSGVPAVADAVVLAGAVAGVSART
jgi:transposase InsO family protein